MPGTAASVVAAPDERQASRCQAECRCCCKRWVSGWRGRPGPRRSRSPPVAPADARAARFRPASTATSPDPAPGRTPSVPCGNASSARPPTAFVAQERRGAWTTMRPRWTPISTPSCARRTRASAAAPASCRSIASRRAVDGAASACRRRNQRSRLRARCARPRRQRRSRQSRSSVGPSTASVADAIRGVERSELVGEPRGVGLVRGCAQRASPGNRGTPRRAAARPRARRKLRRMPSVGVRFVVDPARAPRAVAYARASRARQRRAAGAADRGPASPCAAPASRRARAGPRRAAAAAAASPPGRRRGARARRRRRRAAAKARVARGARVGFEARTGARGDRARARARSGTPRAAHSAAQNAAQASAFGESPWWTWTRGQRDAEPAARGARARRAARIESRPPDSDRDARRARRRGADGVRQAASASRDGGADRVVRSRAAPRHAQASRDAARRRGAAARGSAGRDFLELAVAEDLVLALLEQRVDRLLLQLAQRLGQRLLQRDHHRRVVAVRAAQRLGDDLVDEAELLQPRRGDAEGLGGLRRRCRRDFHRIDAQPSGEITE